MEKECVTAIVLAAGRGSRMKSDIQKQYIEIGGKPVLYYSLREFQIHPSITQIILVTGERETSYCRRQIADVYGFDKITKIVAGGKERYHSVYEGLKAAAGSNYVLIHDGARPFVDSGMIDRCLTAVHRYHACVAGMPVKDTIKISDPRLFAEETPDRKNVWMVQTPQAFEYSLLKKSYDSMMEQRGSGVTDDAMVVELYGKQPVKLVEGSYQNIKITTPDDLIIAEALLKQQGGKDDFH